MKEVTNPELIKKLESKFKEEKSDIDVSGLKEVTDPILKGKLNTLSSEKEEKSFLSGVGESVTEFFTGTKKTEFPEMKEIGEAKDTGADFKIALGLSITPNQQSQIDIILNAVPGSNVMEDKFGNPIIVMPPGS